jgi:hypothetical protein
MPEESPKTPLEPESMYLFRAHPAKQAEMRYKMKLRPARCVVNALPRLKAMRAVLQAAR